LNREGGHGERELDEKGHRDVSWEDVAVGGKKQAVLDVASRLHLATQAVTSLQRGGPLLMQATSTSLPHWHAHTSCLKYTAPIKYSFFPPTGMGKVTAGTYRKGYLPITIESLFPIGRASHTAMDQWLTPS
jgi:hypothetical protein